MCGEFNTPGYLSRIICGSSPHVWGIPQTREVYSHISRFIPTCVGNSIAVCSMQEPLPVHPHMCGEFIIEDNNVTTSSGSSPHVWGIRLAFVLLGNFGRFIPTCVGNSRSQTTRSQDRTVHPHMCGEFLCTVIQ